MSESMKKYFFIAVSCLVLLGVTVTTLVLFFNTFSGPISKNYQDWAALGSYLSGTVGVVAAGLAVVWLMKSVQLQKIELAHLKGELEKSSIEQKNQTYISALSALISSSRQAISEYQQDLIALNAGDKHFHPMLSDVDLRMAMDSEQMKVVFYEKELAKYLKDQYIGPCKSKQVTATSNVENYEIDETPF